MYNYFFLYFFLKNIYEDQIEEWLETHQRRFKAKAEQQKEKGQYGLLKMETCPAVAVQGFRTNQASEQGVYVENRGRLRPDV